MPRTPRVEINTDDRNVVEFGLARSVGRSGGVLVAEIRELARAMGASRPPLDSDAGIAWPAVQTAWANFVEWDVQTDGMRAESAEEQAAAGGAAALLQDRRRAAARASCGAGSSEPPRDPSELAMAADLEAEAGSEAALPLIEQLRAWQPAEADTILATLRFRQSRFDEAAAALESAFVRLRVDPWPVLRFKQKALALAEMLIRAPPRRLAAALRRAAAAVLAARARRDAPADVERPVESIRLRRRLSRADRRARTERSLDRARS